MLEIGKIIGFHGLKGDVKLVYSNRLQKNLSVLKQVEVCTSTNNLEVLDIESFKVHKTNILLKFKQYSNKNDVEHLLGAILKQKKENLAPLDEDEFYINDLVGLNVYDTDNNLVGVVNSVLTNKASDDIIELKTNDNKLKVIPFVEDIVPVIDIANNKIVINNIPGLIDDKV